jgi:hypothetical protein
MLADGALQALGKQPGTRAGRRDSQADTAAISR